MAKKVKAAKGRAVPTAKKKAPPKRAAKPVVKLKVAKAAKKPTVKQNGNGVPRPSTKPYGAAGKALDGVRILDFTHVQSGPTCTQLLAYMGADVIKVERPGVGDITRGQLRDVPNADSLYFTMLNGNKRSITINSKHPEGQGDPRSSDHQMRCAGRELRARRIGSHGADLGAHPQTQSPHDRRLGEGIWSGPVRGLQGL